MVATRFAVATHILLLLAAGLSGRAATSVRIAGSVNTNPVVVRRIAGQLARAGLVRIQRGPGGCELARPAEEITLRDVWDAVEGRPDRRLLPVHANPNPDCRVGCRVQSVLSRAFGAAETALTQALARTTLADLAAGL